MEIFNHFFALGLFIFIFSLIFDGTNAAGGEVTSAAQKLQKLKSQVPNQMKLTVKKKDLPQVLDQLEVVNAAQTMAMVQHLDGPSCPINYHAKSSNGSLAAQRFQKLKEKYEVLVERAGGQQGAHGNENEQRPAQVHQIGESSGGTTSARRTGMVRLRVKKTDLANRELLAQLGQEELERQAANTQQQQQHDSDGTSGMQQLNRPHPSARTLELVQRLNGGQPRPNQAESSSSGGTSLAEQRLEAMKVRKMQKRRWNGRPILATIPEGDEEGKEEESEDEFHEVHEELQEDQHGEIEENHQEGIEEAKGE